MRQCSKTYFWESEKYLFLVEVTHLLLFMIFINPFHVYTSKRFTE
jgi:hypothetical protein